MHARDHTQTLTKALARVGRLSPVVSGFAVKWEVSSSSPG